MCLRARAKQCFGFVVFWFLLSLVALVVVLVAFFLVVAVVALPLLLLELAHLGEMIGVPGMCTI